MGAVHVSAFFAAADRAWPSTGTGASNAAAITVARAPCDATNRWLISTLPFIHWFTCLSALQKATHFIPSSRLLRRLVGASSGEDAKHRNMPPPAGFRHHGVAGASRFAALSSGPHHSGAGVE